MRLTFMKTDAVRETFLEFFKKKGHAIVPSDSLAPQHDPTLLFTGAGMNQFKEYFLGIKKDLKRAASSQKCLRTGDLEEVGRTPYHHSFFEMLGNFSFGDYFKREAITWAWEFLTRELKLPKERLRVSVHKNDEESYKIWRDEIKIREDWISKLGDKSNFWPANAPQDGPNGPCGPCSEIYFDQGEDPKNPHACSIEHDCGRFAEIWNLVFTQFDRRDGGKLVPLENKNIDTGMGLERLACVLQGKKTNFEIDIFQPINDSIEKSLGFKVSEPNRYNLYAISDHTRAVTFAMADGIIPSNEGRGYVIRKLIRRALWQAYQLSDEQLEEPILYNVVPAIVLTMSKAYPELKESKESIIPTLKAEEERFLDTLENGLDILHQRIVELLKTTKRVLSGETVFELYDTYGFPDELTKKIAEQKGFKIDQKGSDRLMEEQRKRAKEASQISSSIFVTSDLEKKIAGLPPTRFLGYQMLESKAKVLFAQVEQNKGVVILDQTPFYAESGGQVGDHGYFSSTSFRARVLNTEKKDKLSVHLIEVESGTLKAGDEVTASVDRNRRERAMRNHTATHLLHAALRKLLGNQVRQLGSLVAPEKLRFDYSYSQPLSAGEIKKIEDMVNEQILKDTAVNKEEKSIEDAKKEGAIAFFGEKYGSAVRVVTVPGFSKELCGGTHCDRTGQIGLFIIVSDSSIASGTRRIEALTGEGALEYARGLRNQVQQMAQSLKTTPSDLPERVAKLQENLKKLEKERGENKSVNLDPEKILSQAQKAGPYRLAAFSEKGLRIDDLRKLSDDIRSRSNKTVYLLASETEEKIQFLLGVSPDLSKNKLDIRELGKELSLLLNGNSGGRPDLVQGGAPNQGQLKEKWPQIIAICIERISKA